MKQRNVPASRAHIKEKYPTKAKKPTGKTFTSMSDQPTRRMLGLKGGK